MDQSYIALYFPNAPDPDSGQAAIVGDMEVGNFFSNSYQRMAHDRHIQLR